uniref:C-Maf-inducing protein PH domain-containing protein n=1 Tax=Ciona savignyi TaxID=51511 RepID=H2Z0L8_CIOSA
MPISREKRMTQSLKVRVSSAQGCEKFKRTSSASNIITSNSTCGQKYNLISEGSLSCLYPNPSSNQSTNLLNRLLHQSKISYSWETHTIVLEESQIVTKTTPKGMFTSGIPFSSILKVTTFKMPKAPKCTKVFTKDGNFLLQAPSVHLQDQWFYSLQWKVTVNKYKDILMEAKSDVLLQELKLLVSLAMSFPLHVADTHIPVLNIVSQLLSKKAVTMSNLSQEELITALAPLVEN